MDSIPSGVKRSVAGVCVKAVEWVLPDLPSFPICMAARASCKVETDEVPQTLWEDGPSAWPPSCVRQNHGFVA